MSAAGDARQKAMDVNRSLRTIKTELEKLLELGAMTDDEFNGVHDQLPQEWSLRGGPPAAKKAAPAAPPATPAVTAPAAAAMPTTMAMGTPTVRGGPQPVYAQHPPLPMRTNASPSPAVAVVPEPVPEPVADGEPAVGYASAKYKYDAPNDGDLAFERGDAIAVYNVINDDWWRGRNMRSGGVGIFPRQYIKPDEALAELERNNQMDAPPPGPPPTRSAAAGGHDADRDRHANNGSAPPAYNDHHGGQPQYGGDAKFAQPYYAGQQQQPQAYGQPYGQPAYGQAQPSYAQQAPYGQQQPYYGAGPSNEQQQQQEQQPGGGEKVKSTGKKIGGKLGNAFVTGVGFAAGAELVGAIL